MYDFAAHLQDLVERARAHGVSNREMELALHSTERDLREARSATRAIVGKVDLSTGEDDTSLGTE